MCKLAITLLATLLVFAVLAIDGSWPVPDVNEPHYLGKARHFWQPDWLAGDFFLDAPHGGPLRRLRESHLVFFAVFGWWSKSLTLPTMALAGRVLTWLGLAYAWQRLSRAMLPGADFAAPAIAQPLLAAFSAALFVAANSWCQTAGEWVIGGFEGKPLAYIFVLLSIEQAVRGGWTAALAASGVATSLHPIVGGWTGLLIVGTWVTRPADRPSLGVLLRALAIAGVLGLPGLIPAALLNWGTPPEVLAEANQIYVYRRAAHHLLPQAFPGWHFFRFCMLALFWTLVCWRSQDERSEHALDDRQPEGVEAQARLRRLVLGSLLLVGCGILVSWTLWWRPEWLAAILRYYWFRMADVLLPLGATFAWLGWLQAQLRTEAAARAAWARRLTAASLLLSIAVALAYLTTHGSQVFHAKQPRGDGPTKVLDYADWRAACDWTAANTPPEALFITPKSSQTFKWHTERRELATWKDMPQDAAGIVEWWRRLVDLYGLHSKAENEWTNAWRLDSLNERSPEQLVALAEKYGADYLLVEAELPLALPRRFDNKSYAIYELRPR